MRRQGTLRHSISIGNHDYDDFNATPLEDDECFRENFGANRYSSEPWFVGEDSTTQTSMAQKFLGAAGEEFLHLNLGYYATDDAIEWAQGVLDANPTLPTIVTTHYYLNGERRSRANVEGPSGDGAVLDGGGKNSGEEIYQKLIYLYPQIFMVLSGHVDGNINFRSANILTYEGIADPTEKMVIEHLVDYQGLQMRHEKHCNETGLMRKLRFRSDEIEFDTVTFSTRNPSGSGFDPGEDADATGCYRCEKIDLDNWRTRISPGEYTLYRMRADLTGNVEDTTLRKDAPSGTPGGAGILSTVRGDNNPGSQERQTLIQFRDLQVPGAGGIPATVTGSDIAKAVLTLTVEGGVADPITSSAATLCNTKIYGIDNLSSVGWSETTASWDSPLFGGDGINIGDEINVGQVPTDLPPCTPLGICDTTLAEYAEIGEVDWRGTRSFDVTRYVANWIDNPSENFGLAILMELTGHDIPINCDPVDDSTFFRSSQWSVNTEKPTLTVVVKTP